MNSEPSRTIIRYKIEYSRALEKHIRTEVPVLRATYKPGFTNLEKKIMVFYLIVENKILWGKGLRVWRELIDKKILAHRTAQSLHNHFMKYILQTLDDFDLSQNLMKQFKSLKNKKRRY